MLDTSEEMLQKQREILFSKSDNERFMIGVKTIEFGRTLVESSIKNTNPDITEIDLKIAVFRRYYTNTFSKEKLEKIIQLMEAYYKRKS